MSSEETFLRSFPRFVESIGRQVTSDDIDTYARLTQIEDTSYRIRMIVEAWAKRQTEERALRLQYAKWLLIALSLQVALVNITFFLIGLNVLSVEKWVATSFILGVFAEVTGMTLVVIRYLFAQPSPGASPPPLQQSNTDAGGDR